MPPKVACYPLPRLHQHQPGIKTFEPGNVGMLTIVGQATDLIDNVDLQLANVDLAVGDRVAPCRSYTIG